MSAALYGLIETRWVPEKDAIVRFFSIGDPGLMEVVVPKTGPWRRKAQAIFNSQLGRFKKLCSDVDGAGLLDFISQLKKKTNQYKRGTARTFNEVRQLNREIGQEAAWTADKLFAIKTGASVVFYGALSLTGLGFVAGTAAGATYSLSTQYAMNRDEAAESSIVAFSSPMAPAVAATTVKAGLNGLSKANVFNAKGSLNALRLTLAAEANAASQLRMNPKLQIEAPRMTPNSFKGGAPRPSLSQAASRLKGAQNAAKGLGFLASLYFLKDDIAMAMNGYTSSIAKRKRR